MMIEILTTDGATYKTRVLVKKGSGFMFVDEDTHIFVRLSMRRLKNISGGK